MDIRLVSILTKEKIGSVSADYQLAKTYSMSSHIQADFRSIQLTGVLRVSQALISVNPLSKLLKGTFHEIGKGILQKPVVMKRSSGMLSRY